MMKFAVSASILLGLVSCVTVPYQPYAREAKKKPGVSGTVAMKLERRAEDEALAQSHMAKNCGSKKVNVDEEGEVVVGEQTDSTVQKSAGSKSDFAMSGFAFGSKPTEDSSGSSTKTALKEWHITYSCK